MARINRIYGFAMSTTLIVSTLLTATFASPIAYGQSSPSTDSIPPLPASMGSLGDSITAGFLAAFKRQDGGWPWVDLSFLGDLMGYGMTHDYADMEYRNLSWSTGWDSGTTVLSQARRIATLRHKNGLGKLKFLNAAVSGSEVLDVLQSQVPDLSSWSQENLQQFAPDYVTLLIGANDICADSAYDMTSTNTYYGRLQSVVQEMLDKSPNTRIEVVSLPNINSLRDKAMDQNDLSFLGIFNMSCEQVWEAANLCPTLTTISDPAQREMIGQRVLDYNSAMQDIVEKSAADYGDRIRFASNVYNIDFTAEDISMDCFHPNPYGQNMLSQATWSQSWWAPMWTQRMENHGHNEGY